MPTVLDSLIAQRAEAIGAMDSVLGQVDGDRDLVDAERTLLEATQQRIAELDRQIEPLEQYEALRAAHGATLDAYPRSTVPAEPRRIAGDDAQCDYRSAGAFLVDYLRARGIMDRDRPDPEAMGRITRAVANQVTGDTPGILPTPIVGSVVNIIDANRPLVTSLGGAIGLGGIPGKTFSRPKITQHTTVGKQAAEKTELPSQGMKINPINFTKDTYGGTVDISRQDIDWTSPGAWDILIRDLADIYAVQTETAIALAFAAVASTNVPIAVDTPDLAGWATALYAAAAQSYRGGKRMPDRVWCSIDVWAEMGALVDVGRLVMPPSQTEQPAGETSLATFAGNVIALPRIVVPTFGNNTCIVGPSNLYEVYEEVIGLLSVVEPSILGVTVAYGGYVAQGALEATAFIPVTPPVPVPGATGATRAAR